MRETTKHERQVDQDIDDRFGARWALAILVALAAVVIATKIARNNGKPWIEPAEPTEIEGRH